MQPGLNVGVRWNTLRPLILQDTLKQDVSSSQATLPLRALFKTQKRQLTLLIGYCGGQLDRYPRIGRILNPAED